VVTVYRRFFGSSPGCSTGSPSAVRSFRRSSLNFFTSFENGKRSVDWLCELKYDGFRALLEIDGHGARLVSRNRNRFKYLDPLAAALAKRLRVACSVTPTMIAPTAAIAVAMVMKSASVMVRSLLR
jgi:hypothetical protein